MTAERLLRLFPRAWRERYGAEFLDTVGGDALRLQQVIDIVSGALDAWLSADVRRATGTCPVSMNEGGSKMVRSMRACARTEARVTTRDSLLGAGVMTGGALLFVLLGGAARSNGLPVPGEVLTGAGFPASLMLSLPFWLTKGLPWKVQALFVGGTVAALLAIGYLAAIT